MNWNIKDENVKNRLWLERCRKDAAANASRPATAMAPGAPSMETLSKEFVTQHIQHRDPRFLDRNKPLLVSMSRYIAEDNMSPLAIQLRKFSRLRPNKVCDNSLNFAPNRASKIAAASAARVLRERLQRELAGGEENDMPLAGGVRVGAARCRTYAAPVAPAAAHGHFTATEGSLPPATSPQQLTSTISEIQDDAPTNKEAPNIPPKVLPFRAPTLMRPSSADYGWVPGSTLGADTKTWRDPRFHHSLVSTDVTKR
jgi:hypothetical protein